MPYRRWSPASSTTADPRLRQRRLSGRAQHFAAELVGRFEAERQELAAIALTTDSSILTAVANDYAFDVVFAKRVRARPRRRCPARHLDLGQLRQCHQGDRGRARQRHERGRADRQGGGGKIGQMLREGDIHLCVPAERTARIQETHLLAIHCLCDGIDCLLLGLKNEENTDCRPARSADCPTLSGCVAAVATGATAGALAVMDRRTFGTQTEDEGISGRSLAT